MCGLFRVLLPLSLVGSLLLVAEGVPANFNALHRAPGAELPVVNVAGHLPGVIRATDILREWADDWQRTWLGDETGSFY